MSKADIAKNLMRLRNAKGISQADAAESAGLSYQGYRKIERGEVIPRVSTLQKLAGMYEVRLRDLVVPSKTIRRLRFRSLKKLNGHEQIIAEVSRWLEDYNYLEKLVNDHKPYSLGKLALEFSESEPTIEKAINAAQRTREIMNLAPSEPIRNVNGILNSSGIKIFQMKKATDAFFGLSVAEEDGGPAIVVNTWDKIPVERWIFSAVHELGHLILHLDSFTGWQESENEREEKEANIFASHFLMPNEAFEKEWKSNAGLNLFDRIIKLKRIFFVSYATVVYRLVENDVMDNKVYSLFKAEYKRRKKQSLDKHIEPFGLSHIAFVKSYSEWQKSYEPASLTKYDCTEDRLLKLVRKAIEDGTISFGRSAEILRKSSEEMRELTSCWV